MDDEDDEDELDLENLKSLFGNSPKNKKKKKKRMSQMSKGEIEAANKNKKNVRLLDSKRAYNVEISLSKFRKFESYEAIGDAIENSDNRLDLDMYILLKKIYPTSTETTVLKRYRGEVQSLGKAEQFQLAMLRVPRCLEKIDCSLFCVEFPQLIDELNAKMDLLIKTSDAIVKCDPLVNVLKKVLKVGNTMNQGTRSGGAKGFTLDSLSKLSTTKGADKKTTVLDVVVAMIFKKTLSEEAGDASEEKETHNPFAWVDTDLKILMKAREESQRELQNAVLKIFQQTKKYNSLLSQGLFKSHVMLGGGDTGADDADTNILQTFASNGQNKSLLLRKKNDLLTQKATELAGYWGEDPRDMPIPKVSSILAQFTTNLKQSVVRLLRMNENAKKVAKRWREKARKHNNKSGVDGKKKNTLAMFEEQEELIGGNRGALLNSLVSANPLSRLKGATPRGGGGRKRAVTTSVLKSKKGEL